MVASAGECTRATINPSRGRHTIGSIFVIISISFVVGSEKSPHSCAKSFLDWLRLITPTRHETSSPAVKTSDHPRSQFWPRQVQTNRHSLAIFSQKTDTTPIMMKRRLKTEGHCRGIISMGWPGAESRLALWP